MEDRELQALWASYSQKIDENTALQRQNAVEISQLKAKSLLASVRPGKILGIVVGIL
jgi:hypothetical protein